MAGQYEAKLIIKRVYGLSNSQVFYLKLSGTCVYSQSNVLKLIADIKYKKPSLIMTKVYSYSSYLYLSKKIKWC